MYTQQQDNMIIIPGKLHVFNKIFIIYYYLYIFVHKNIDPDMDPTKVLHVPHVPLQGVTCMYVCICIYMCIHFELGTTVHEITT